MTFEAVFQTIFSFIQVNGYLLLFLGMIIEGPVITTTFSFAASLGYFNVFVILLLSITGDVIGDFLHFVAGKFIGKKGKKFEGRIGLSKKRRAFIEGNLKNHLIKTILFLKMIPPITSAGLLFVGSSKIKFRKLILASFLATLPMSIFYVCLGYFFGAFAKTIFGYLRMGEYVILAFIIFVILAYFLVKIIAKKTEKLEEKLIK